MGCAGDVMCCSLLVYGNANEKENKARMNINDDFGTEQCKPNTKKIDINKDIKYHQINEIF